MKTALALAPLGTIGAAAYVMAAGFPWTAFALAAAGLIWGGLRLGVDD